jgi:hypothetical protein
VLEGRAERGDAKTVLQQLGTLVPTFRPSSEWESAVLADRRIPPVAVVLET